VRGGPAGTVTPQRERPDATSIPDFGEKHAGLSADIAGADIKIAVAITKIAVADEKM
jgi:hypothetical protein